MPICSYVVFPEKGCKETLAAALNNLPGCEATTAENKNVLILVTETVSDEEENALQKRLQALPEIQCLTLTFGEIEPQQKQELEHG